MLQVITNPITRRRLREMVVDEMCRDLLTRQHELTASEIKGIEESEKALEYATEVYNVLEYLYAYQHQHTDIIFCDVEYELQKLFTQDIPMIVVLKWLREYISQHPKEFTFVSLQFIENIVKCFPGTKETHVRCVELIEFLHGEKLIRLEQQSTRRVRFQIGGLVVVCMLFLILCKFL